MQSEIEELVRNALAEDLGDHGDVTSQLVIPASSQSTAEVRARVDGVFAGAPVLDTFVQAGISTPHNYTRNINDSESFVAGQILAEITGATQELLAIERPLLNAISHLCGIATETRRWVQAVEGTGAVVRDTRKTLPGWRKLQKYAVRCGGGENHRMGMYDGILIKDNHIAACGSITKAVHQAMSSPLSKALPCEVEVDSLDDLREAIEAGATCILLDNMNIGDIKEAVAIKNSSKSEIKLEASGGLTLDTARSIAETGVDYLAVGSLTHSVKICDIGIDFRN